MSPESIGDCIIVITIECPWSRSDSSSVGMSVSKKSNPLLDELTFVVPVELMQLRAQHKSPVSHLA